MFFRRSSNAPRRRVESRTSEPDSTQQNYFRNRTLSGVRPKNDEEQSSERTKAHRLSRLRRRILAILGLILLACILIFVLLAQFTSRVAITVSQASLSRDIDRNAYIETINDYYEMHPVERLRFSLSRDQLTQFVIDKHPEISTISQSTIWGVGETRFSISLRQPVAGWKIGDRQYYVDENGIAFEKNYFDTPSVQVIDNGDVTYEEGTTVTSTRFLGFIGKIVSLSKGRGYMVTQANLPLGTTREVDIRLDGITTYIKLSIDRGAGEQVEDMDRSLKYLRSKGLSPSYLDVRVESRAFYQ
jgi:cell division septal protein FtsQ